MGTIKCFSRSKARLYDNGHAELLDRQSSITLYDSSTCNVLSSKHVVAYNNSVVIERVNQFDRIKLHDSARRYFQEKQTQTNETFANRCERIGDKIVLYKIVNDSYMDFYTKSIKYEVGKEVICPDFDPDETRQCGGGLHLSPKITMAMEYNNPGKILRCLVDPGDIVVYTNDLTKVRCRKVYVLEEVSETEFEHYLRNT